MVPADIHLVADIQVAGIRAAGIRVADIQVADIRVAVVRVAVVRVAVVRNLVVGCYKDPLVEVVMGERNHHTDLADLGLDPD